MSGGHRSVARRRVSPTAVIALLLPVLTVGALALVRPDAVPSAGEPPQEVRPTRVDLVCPSALDDPGVVVAAARSEAGGTLTSTAGTGGGAGDVTSVDVRGDAVSRVKSPPPTRLRATGELASQVIGARFATRGLAATECVLPRSDYWFSGVGAGADHASVLELTNPDDGPAVADVSVWARNGPLDVPHLRGVTVPGGETIRLDLAEEVPRRTELGMEVVVSRGRLAASVADGVPPLGSRPGTRDWLPASAEPATDQLLLGLAAGAGDDVLVLTNPGEDEARVELQVVTEEAAFVPEGQEEIRVPPGSVANVPVTGTVRDAVREGAVGLRLVASAPVSATLRSLIDDDLVHAVPVAGSADSMTGLVPPGSGRLVLARAGGAGVAQVTTYADGKRLDEERVELTEGGGASLSLPEGADLVRVVPKRTDVAAAVITSGRGSAVVPLGPLVRRALIPAVRPGLP